MGESIQGLSFVDKLNLLERVEIIEDAYWWKDLRDLRNKLSHEYDINRSAKPSLLIRYGKLFL